ncbi:MAG: universal stress protein [Chitinophagaceae bacterium]|nr:universal stress protein [Chitinophagaceae bacterium]
MSEQNHSPVVINKILVPTDFSAISLLALEYAGLIASKTNATIILLHVFESYMQNTMLHATVDFNNIMEKGIEEKMHEIVGMDQQLNGVRVETRVAHGKIHVEIEQIVKQDGISLIVMGTHGVSGVTNIGKFMVGSNAYRTMQNATCPIITLRNEPSKKSFKNIVLPIDSSAKSTMKLDIAIAWAKLFGSTIHLLAVTAFFEEFVVDAKAVDRKVHQVEELLVKEGIPYTAHIIRNQSPSLSVLHHAEKMNADLIMIVSGQESQLGEMLFGSISRAVVSDSPIPVLSIHINKN